MYYSTFSKTLIASICARAVLSSPIAHFHHKVGLEKRVITHTQFTTENSYTTVTMQGPVPTTTFTEDASTETSSPPPPESSTPPAPSGSDSGSSDSSSGDSKDTPSSGGSKGITYSPYSNSGGCKDLDTVKQEFTKLTDFDVIRIYGVDCSQVENVLQAKTDKQKILAGIFFMDKIEDSVSTIASAVSAHGSWDDIYAVTVGNELVNNGAASVDSIKQYIETAKGALTSSGYEGKVTTVDTFNAVQGNSGLCTAGDFVAINAHAFFDSTCTAENAGEWLKDTVASVAKVCGIDAEEILVTESGWPSQGKDNGQAKPTGDNQKAAIASIKEKMGNQTLLFTAFNDAWKQPGAFEVEPFFGLY